MRIAILKSRFDQLGGLEKYTLRLAKAFQKAGNAVTILTTGSPKPIDQIEVISLGKNYKTSLYHLFSFNQKCEAYLKAHPFDAIFGMERTTFQTHYRAGSGVHAVYLKRRSLTDSCFKQISFKINPLHRYLLHLEKKAFESSHLKVLFTNSHMVKQEILEHYKIEPAKISVVHNGVEWFEWEEPFQKTFENRPKAPFHFLFVGNGYRRKGLQFLLQGLKNLNTNDFVLTVVGKDKEREYFEKLVAKLNLKKQVIFAGPQKKMIPFYQAADALAIPSIYDPFANVTVEALAMGLFVVSSKYNGGHEVLTEKTGAVIEDLTSEESVAQSLKIALEHPKTTESAQLIRSSIKGLDFSNQLDKIIQQT